MPTIFNVANTIAGRVTRILNFLDTADEIYVGIGRSAPWDQSFGNGVNDLNPPRPSVNLINIPDPIIYKKATIVAPAIRSLLNPEFNQNIDPLTSTILVQQSINEQNFAIIDPNDIINESGEYNVLPEFVYIVTEIDSNDYEELEWRAMGLFTRIFLADGVPEGSQVYTNNQVTGGIIQLATFNSPVERDDGVIHKFEFLINL